MAASMVSSQKDHGSAYMETGAWHEGCISAVKWQNGSRRAPSALTWILHELSWLQTFSLFYDPSYRLLPD